jgi:hypothetical protein
VYPHRDSTTGVLTTAEALQVAPNLRHLHAYLVENGYIEGLRDVDASCLPIFSRDVLAKIRARDAAWETMVPEEVVALVKKRGLFGY